MKTSVSELAFAVFECKEVAYCKIVIAHNFASDLCVCIAVLLKPLSSACLE